MPVGSQDRPDVVGPPPPERHRSLECPQQRLGAVRGAQGELPLGVEPLGRDGVDLAVTPGVDLLAPRLRAGIEPRDAVGPRVLIELEINIVGTYNVVAAAVASGCRRVLFASSVHAVSGYPRGLQVREDDPINPGNLYGVSKCFGEALGRYAAEQEGLSFIALRIGAFDPTVTASDVGRGWTLEEYCAPGDLIELIKLCVDDERIRFEIFNATSDNRFNRLDVTKARRLLGYKPVFDAFAMVPAVREALGAADPGAWRELSGMGGEVGMDELGES